MWVNTDIKEEIVGEIYQKYDRAYVEVSHTGLADTVYLDMESIRSEVSNYGGTLSHLLDAYGNTAIKTVKCIPSTDLNLVGYMDLNQYGYHITLGRAGYPADPATLPADLPDLAITRSTGVIDHNLFHTHALITVNGYHHMTAADSTIAYALDAGSTRMKSKSIAAGCIDFSDVGKLTKIPLKDLEIFPAIEGGKLKDQVIIETGHDLSNKSVLLSLGGYLVLPEEGKLWISGDQFVTLNFSRFRFLERLYESMNFLDLSSLGLQPLYMSKDSFSVEDIMSDEVIRKYFDLSQSFLVIVDTERLVFRQRKIRHYDTPGKFTSYEKPNAPLISGFGRMPEYWTEENRGIYEMTVVDSWYRNYLFTTTEERLLNYIGSHLIASRRVENSRGILLEIGSYRDVDWICKP